jgi:excisionase family DNA binding protein
MDSKFLVLLKNNPEVIAKIIELNSLLIQLLTSFLTFDEACTYLQLEPSHLQKLCKQNIIPHYNPVGKKFLFRKEELDVWTKNKPKTKTRI